MSVRLEPVRIIGLEGGDGRLVFAGEVLVAVLIRLSELHEEEAGKWFVEAGFGPLERMVGLTFNDLDIAERQVASSPGLR